MKATKYIELTPEQIQAVKELVDTGSLSLALRDIEMTDIRRLDIIGTLFDYADSGNFSDKVLHNEYTDDELIDFIKDETEVTIDKLIQAYKLSKSEKRDLICDFLGVNHLTTNEELSQLIKDY